MRELALTRDHSECLRPVEWENEPQPRVVRLVSGSAQVGDHVRVTVAGVEGEGRVSRVFDSAGGRRASSLSEFATRARSEIQMADVFIAYARLNAVIADQVSSALVEAGFTVFKDITVSVGEKWLERIEKEVQSAKCVLVLWTPESRDSMWVHGEADISSRVGNLFSVKCDEVLLTYPANVWAAKAFVDWNTRSADGLAMVVQATRKFIDSRAADKGS